jgi:hypothetical protein
MQRCGRPLASRPVAAREIHGFRQQETTLAEKSKKDDAQAQFQKLQRAEDGKKAMSEYEAEGVATRAKTERLRALRLARDAAEAAAAPPKKTGAAKKKKAPVKKKGAKGASLSGFLEDQDVSGRRS